MFVNKLKKVYNILFYANFNSVFLCKLALKLNDKGFPFLALLVKNRLITKYGIHLGLSTKIGEGLILPHPSGIVIGKGVIIGDNCRIYQNVTLGTKHSTINREVSYPNIGDHVTIYTGAIILGGIKVGNNTIIGANSLVVEDLEPNSLYAGSPARLIKKL